MNCEQMTLLLSAWLDGELTKQEEEQMRGHLEQCTQCRALFEQLQTLHTSFSDLEEIQAPKGFAQNVMQCVAEESKPKIAPLFKRPQVRALSGVAACALLCIGFGRMILGGGASAPTAPEAAPDMAAYSVEQEAQESAEYGVELTTAPAEPAAPEVQPVPDMADKLETAESSVDARKADGAERAGENGEAVIVLSQLPEGMEEVLGQLAWEEQTEDGAVCARLTEDQARQLLELIHTQGLAVEQTMPNDGGDTVWTLILQTNGK